MLHHSMSVSWSLMRRSILVPGYPPRALFPKSVPGGRDIFAKKILGYGEGIFEKIKKLFLTSNCRIMIKVFYVKKTLNKSLQSKGNGLFACKNRKICHLKLLICAWGQGQGRDFCPKMSLGAGTFAKIASLSQGSPPRPGGGDPGTRSEHQTPLALVWVFMRRSYLVPGFPPPPPPGRGGDPCPGDAIFAKVPAPGTFVDKNP